MKYLQEYREHAAECRSMAAKIRDEALRQQMLNMAGAWDRLADERGREKLLRENIVAAPPSEAPDPTRELTEPRLKSASSGSGTRPRVAR